MKFFKIILTDSGRKHVYLCGMKIASYKSHNAINNNLVIGINNKIVNPQKECRCFIYGNNNKVVFGENIFWVGSIHIGLTDLPVDNCSVVIGDNSTSNGCNIRICEDNTNVEIGLDCMFSSGINIWASDTHTITDMDGNCLNVGKYVKIGNHVWIGSNVSIAKNTVVADGCVVGMATVLTGKHDEQNCVIAGNPSKKVKQNIKWDRRRPKQYIKEEKNENS